MQEVFLETFNLEIISESEASSYGNFLACVLCSIMSIHEYHGLLPFTSERRN